MPAIEDKDRTVSGAAQVAADLGIIKITASMFVMVLAARIGETAGL